MRAALICSEDSVFNRHVLPSFLSSFSELVAIVAIRDSQSTRRRRMKFEWRRSRWRILDVLAFRAFYRLRLADRDRDWIQRRAESERANLPPEPTVPIHVTETPNSPETRAFLERAQPDFALAACKTLLKRDIFDVPRHGTFVVHPGICPEYRNSHGCFWALARRDLDHVGATLLQIDEGSDTGPVYAYYTTDYDEKSESHVVIQTRVVYDNLESIKHDLEAIVGGEACNPSTSPAARPPHGASHADRLLRWKRAARNGS